MHGILMHNVISLPDVISYDKSVHEYPIYATEIGAQVVEMGFELVASEEKRQCLSGLFCSV